MRLATFAAVWIATWAACWWPIAYAFGSFRRRQWATSACSTGLLRLADNADSWGIENRRMVRKWAPLIATPAAFLVNWIVA